VVRIGDGMYPSSLSQSEPSARSDAESGADRVIRILLIEDNPADVTLINEILKEARLGRFDLVTADRLSKCPHLIEVSAPDVILLDLGLPDSKGLDTIRRVSAWKLSIPVIVLTGLTDDLIGLEAVKLGAQDYLVKDEVDPSGLDKSIRYAIERKKSFQALRESEERYSRLFHNNHAIMLLIDGETGRILDANASAAQFYGYPREIMLTLSVHELSTLMKQEVDENLKKAGKMEQLSFLVKHRMASGGLRCVQVYDAPVVLKGKKVIHRIVFDVTNRVTDEKLRRQAYIQIEKNIENFATLIDEIRNPTFVIMQLANRTDSEDCAKIQKQAERIEALVKQLEERWVESEKVRESLRRSVLRGDPRDASIILNPR